MGQDDSKYPFHRVFEIAELASMLKPDAVTALKQRFRDEDSAVRYWAVMGILMRGRGVVESARDDLAGALTDISPFVRTAAAEALGKYGNDIDLKQALAVLIELSSSEKNGVFASLAALNALDSLGNRAAAAIDALKSLPSSAKVPDARYSSYVPRLLEDLLNGRK